MYENARHPPLVGSADPAPAAIDPLASPDVWQLAHEKLFLGKDAAGQDCSKCHASAVAPVLTARAPVSPTLEQAIDAGLEAYRLREFGRALACCDQAERLAPTSPRPWTLRGHVHWALDDLEGARSAYDRALQVDPNHVPALTYRSRLRLQLKDVAGAIADVRHALELAPDSDIARESLRAAETAAQLEQMLRTMGEKKEPPAAGPTPHDQLKFLLGPERRHKAAEAYQAGLRLFEQKRYIEAHVRLEEAIGLSPAHRDARKLLDEVRRRLH